jgi:prepilin-type N-terminal cleavage/methylation domain-containing protein
MGTYAGRMRRGYSLLETLLSLVIVGVLLGIALPRFGAFRDQLAVEEESGRIAAAHRRARITAILQSRPVVLTIGPDSLTIAVVADSGMPWSQAGPAAHGVTLAGGSRQLTFSPAGITIGVSNATFRLTRGAFSRTVVVSRLGRLRIR